MNHNLMTPPRRSNDSIRAMTINGASFFTVWKNSHTHTIMKILNTRIKNNVVQRAAGRGLYCSAGAAAAVVCNLPYEHAMERTFTIINVKCYYVYRKGCNVCAKGGWMVAAAVAAALSNAVLKSTTTNAIRDDDGGKHIFDLNEPLKYSYWPTLLLFRLNLHRDARR